MAMAVPPPPEPDLDAVYRPEEDPVLQSTLGTGPPAAAASRSEEAAALPDLLGGDLLGEPRAPAPASAMMPPLLDFGDDDDRDFQGTTGAAGSGKAATQDDGVTDAGLLKQLPPGVEIESPKKTCIDLSTPAAPVSLQPAAAEAGGGAVAASAGPQPIPRDKQGFGSEDLFGGGKGSGKGQDRSIKDEAAAAWSSVCSVMPDKVRDNIPDCMAPQVDEASELVVAAAPEEQAAHAASATARQVGLPDTPSAVDQQAVNRACEGRWVPTYMRHQMAAHGHTALPSAPNAHEHRASVPPPSVSETFSEMGNDVGETAQNVLTIVLAFLSSVATQLQVCSTQTATNIHDQVVTYGEGFCQGQADDRGTEEVVMGPLPSEAAAGLGPMRSRVTRTMQGVPFATLMEVVKTKLTTPQAPPEFQRVVKVRELKGFRSNAERGWEDLVFHTEVSMEAVPHSALQHVCMGFGPLACRETWHVELQESRAGVEISNVLTTAAVSVCIRMDITKSSDPSQGASCEVDSRLYVQPRQTGAVLPLGLVEQLTELHHQYSETLRDVFLVLAYNEALTAGQQAPPPAMAPPGAVTAAHATPAAGMNVGPPPSVPVPHGGRPLAAEASTTTGVGQMPMGGVGLTDGSTQAHAPARAAEVNRVPDVPPTWSRPEQARDGAGVDASLLLQVADGI